MSAIGLLALGVAGYLLACAAVPGRAVSVRLALGFALGQAAFLFHVNLLLRAGLGIHVSSWAALALVLLEAGGIRWVAHRETRGAREPAWHIADLRLLGLAALPFLHALLWQLAHRDEDYFIYWPLAGLFRRDVFPPVNPFFPGLPYTGHYGRLLLGAGLSFFWPGDFHDLLLWQTAIGQACLLVLVFSVFRRQASAASGALAVTLAFLGVNASIRLGLLDTFQNNNALANVLFFSAVTVLSDPAAMRRLAGRLCTFLILSALALVYETHWVCLMGGAMLALLPAALSRSGRLRALRMTTVAAFSAFVAVGQGGTLTNWLERHVADRHERSEAIVGLSQEVNVRFPKTSLTVTAHDGQELPLLSAGFRAEAGPWPLGLPVFALLLALRGAAGPLVVALAGALRNPTEPAVPRGSERSGARAGRQPPARDRPAALTGSGKPVDRCGGPNQSSDRPAREAGLGVTMRIAGCALAGGGGFHGR